MKIIRQIAPVISVLFVLLSCQNNESDLLSDAEIERRFSALEDNKAVAIFKIGNKPFYTEEIQPFGVRIDVSFASLRGNLMNEEGANLLFDFARSDWYTQQPVIFKLTSSSSGFSTDYGKLMIGKRLSQGLEELEGYIFVDGTFTVLQFTEERFVAVVKGKVTKPGDADIPENMESIEGFIIAKKPPMTFDSIDKNLIFYK